jgi:hypothetical protein
MAASQTRRELRDVEAFNVAPFNTSRDIETSLVAVQRRRLRNAD